MSRGRKSSYPERPIRKGRPKSSQSGGGKRKTWLSDRSVWEGGRDISPKQNTAFYRQPLYVSARVKKWAQM